MEEEGFSQTRVRFSLSSHLILRDYSITTKKSTSSSRTSGRTKFATAEVLFGKKTIDVCGWQNILLPSLCSIQNPVMSY
jgi:hypothetical protein